jgi:hypothetical protein
MSFAMTTPQVEDQSKTITRRLGWKHLKVGDLVQPALKCMGLKKGEKIKKVGPPVRITSVRMEALEEITAEDVRKEGFPDWGVQEFIAFFCKLNKCAPTHIVNRIEFEYINSGDSET